MRIAVFPGGGLTSGALRILKLPALLALWIGLAASAYSKAAYSTYPERNRNSDIIAMVNVTGLTEGPFKGKHMTYRQKVTIGTDGVWKGET